MLYGEEYILRVDNFQISFFFHLMSLLGNNLRQQTVSWKTAVKLFVTKKCCLTTLKCIKRFAIFLFFLAGPCWPMFSI